MLFLKMIRIVLKRQIVSCLVYRILFIDSEGEERQEPNQISVDPEFPDFPDFSNLAKTIGTYNFLLEQNFFLDSDGEERQEPTQIPVDPEYPDFPDFSNSARTIGTFFLLDISHVVC